MLRVPQVRLALSHDGPQFGVLKDVVFPTRALHALLAGLALRVPVTLGVHGRLGLVKALEPHVRVAPRNHRKKPPVPKCVLFLLPLVFPWPLLSVVQFVTCGAWGTLVGGRLLAAVVPPLGQLVVVLRVLEPPPVGEAPQPLLPRPVVARLTRRLRVVFCTALLVELPPPLPRITAPPLRVPTRLVVAPRRGPKQPLARLIFDGLAVRIVLPRLPVSTPP